MKSQNSDPTIRAAINILNFRLKNRNVGASFAGCDDIGNFLLLNNSLLEHEEFSCMFLNSRLQLISYDVMFIGSLSHCSVYPRELVKRALYHNAAGVVLVHNHPAGLVEPSSDDILLTEKLKGTLALVDVYIVDHFIVAGMEHYSMKENGDI